MSPGAAQRFGPYEILGKLGEGGMGEVYRARDTRLKREVALKILSDSFAGKPDVTTRFHREAQVLASFNHPYIAAIHGLEESEGSPALVMELIEGPTLAERIEASPVPLEEALEVARKVAEALEYAHERGIVHRDLKPANIKVTDGKVKVLDFGLAKSANDDRAISAVRDSVTLSINVTQSGAIVGTVAYMSPEQAKGKPVDRRADIWAFGVVLYEMLTGQQPFAGETLSDVLSAVLMKEPDWTALPASTPAGVRQLMERCLRKDVKSRLQSIGDARVAVEEALAEPPAQATPSAAARRFAGIWAPLAALFAATSLALGVAYFRGAPEEPHMLKFFVYPPEKAKFVTTSAPAVSPDGRHIAFAATAEGKVQLWVRDLDSLAARALDATEGGEHPFWSPDGRSVAFFAGGRLRKTSLQAGGVQTVCDAPVARGGAWNEKGVIVFAPSNVGGLHRVSSAGGKSTPITTLDNSLGQISHRWPFFLPDGRHFLFTALSSDREKTAIYVGDLESKELRRVVNTQFNAAYALPGFLLYLHEQTLMARPFDAGRIEITGPPRPIAEPTDYSAVYFQGHFAVSQDGMLAYYSGVSSQNAQMTWFDRAGKALGPAGAPGSFFVPAISPDGGTVAMDRYDARTGALDIWLRDLTRGADTRFTFDPSQDINPVWSPDGSRIAFASIRGGQFDLYQKTTRGADEEQVLFKSALSKAPSDWSRDGQFIIYNQNDPKTKWDIWVLPLSGDPPVAGTPFPFLQSPSNEGWGKLSPNGKWLAYYSDETGRSEIYVEAFPRGPSGAGRKWQVSSGGVSGGSRPVWSRDGKELFYLGLNQQLMMVKVNTGSAFEANLPQPLFAKQLQSNSQFDVSADGLRFLMVTTLEDSASKPMTVVANWNALARK